MNAINNIFKSKTPVGLEMKRFLLARDFHPGTLIPGDKPLGDKPLSDVLTDLQAEGATGQQKAKAIQQILEQLTESQLKAFHAEWDNPHFLQLVTGPFVTGKSTWIVRFARILNILGLKVLLLASSNAALDGLMSKVLQEDPDTDAIRAHSLSAETEDTKRKAKQGWESRRKGSC